MVVMVCGVVVGLDFFVMRGMVLGDLVGCGSYALRARPRVNPGATPPVIMCRPDGAIEVLSIVGCRPYGAMVDYPGATRYALAPG